MPDSEYDVQYYMLCDLVRLENTGKEIIVGTYNDYVITNSVPLVLPMLCVRVSVRLKRRFDMLNFELRSPSGNAVCATSSSVNEANNILGQQSIFNMHMGVPVILSELGEYEIRFGLDEQAKKIGFFIVRLPEAAAEQERLIAAGGGAPPQKLV